MSRTLFTNIEECSPRLINQTEFRNIRILTYYEALQDIEPDMKYADKIRAIALKFDLSDKSIDAIICSYTRKTP